VPRHLRSAEPEPRPVPSLSTWAIIELRDQRRLGGFISEHPIAGAAFLRLEVPGPDGDDPVATHFYPPSALFSITPTSERMARAAALSDRPPVPVERIKRVVAEFYQISPAELTGKNRERGVSEPRQIAMYLARELTGHSLPAIGRAFGARHHTTALRSIDKVSDQVRRDPRLRQQIESVRAWLALEGRPPIAR
jgi:hypothetical protein